MWPAVATVALKLKVKVTGSHIHFKSGNISEVVQDRDAFTRSH